MQIAMGILWSIWASLGVPLRYLEVYTGIALDGFWDTLGRIAVGLVAFYIVISLWRFVLKQIGKVMGRKRLSDERIGPKPVQDTQFTESLSAAKDLEATILPLKKNKQYARLAEVYASLNRYKEAAKWFRKAGRRRDAATALARAGKTAQAAKLLMKEGEFAGAGRLLAEIGKHTGAAAAFIKAGKPAEAAGEYAKARQAGDAANMYADYFASPKDPAGVQVQHAEACLQLLESPYGKKGIDADQRLKLVPALAKVFEISKRYDVASELYKQSGNLVRAGEVNILGGRIEEAARLMKEAGKDKEALRLMGQVFERKGEHKRAAQAYAQAGEFLRAGDCFAHASDVARAAECFEHAREHYRAALAYAHAARYEDAIRMLQRIPETDSNYDQSRALMGRCFYELHDYPHCAAALDNHLTGKRVDSSTVDYWYMLALAYEQLGKLDESRAILYKIRTVDVKFRDVGQRISRISTRLSEITGESTGGGAAKVSGDQVATHVMESVENSLGGRYQLEEELGRGGMGVVYRAKDRQLDRSVALKFLGSLVDNSEEYRERFIREARTAARISHPNIISIYDISASVGKAYIAMEFVDGPSLHKFLLQKGRLQPPEAINIISQACGALAAIHEAGIVHRDIKPDNILIAKGGLVKLTDFGLAKAEDNRMTRTGIVMGTPSYMAPEQVLGKDADPRTDVYALGLVLHECLTGKCVFADGDVLERQLKEMPPPPSAKAPLVKPELDALVAQCIQKKPEARFQSARELHTALRSLK